ncbi:MAG TPA: helix-turn-helix domain-containing protein [Chitinophagaceae bacterium]|nr:helix-turn-helix domain-containing protein [Chitinophagaceae bacterium]
MNYQVYDPIPELTTFVKCFWSLDDDGKLSASRQRIIPDGCMEMIFHYGDPYKQYLEDGNSVIQPRSFIFGQITKYIEIEPTGISGIVAARFYPEGLIPFLNVPVSTLGNKAVALAKIFGEKGKTLEQEIMLAETNVQRIKLLERFLLSQLTDPKTIDNITRACVETILQSKGQLDVIKLAGKIKINRRSIERRFVSTVGLSPKQLSRLVRLQATLKMLEQKNFSNLTSLAYENGYYDQAHFIRDFKEFTGVSPKSFFADNLKLSGLFIAAE